MKIVTTDLLRHVSAQARTNPRLRQNYNIHSSDNSRCHRLLNAMEPASYIRPHRHLDPEKDEAFILMSGRLGIITFHDNGDISEKLVLSFQDGILAADIPNGIFHTALSLESGTVFYEAKAGPYHPLTDDEKASWAPGDGDPGALIYLELLQNLFIP